MEGRVWNEGMNGGPDDRASIYKVERAHTSMQHGREGRRGDLVAEAKYAVDKEVVRDTCRFLDLYSVSPELV